MAILNLELYQNTASLERLLQAQAEAIRECGRQIDLAANSGNDDWSETVTEDECGVIEDFLGVAFVSCQVFISAALAGTRYTHAVYSEGEKWSKGPILKIGSPILALTPFTRIEVIDAFANYFKHRDEWDFDWINPTPRARPTVDLIQAVGAVQNSTGNLRVAAKALGITDYENLSILHRDVSEWSHAALNEYRMRMNAAHNGMEPNGTGDASN